MISGKSSLDLNSKGYIEAKKFYDKGCQYFNEQNYKMAYETFTIAAAKHIPAAMKALGQMHLYNIYADKSEEKAAQWFKKAIALYKKHDQWDKVLECYQVMWPQLKDSTVEDLKIIREKGVIDSLKLLEAVQK